MLTCLTCSSKSSSVSKLLFMGILEGDSDSAESHSTVNGTQISCVYFFSLVFVKTLFFSLLFSAVNLSKNLRFSGQ